MKVKTRQINLLNFPHKLHYNFQTDHQQKQKMDENYDERASP